MWTDQWWFIYQLDVWIWFRSLAAWPPNFSYLSFSTLLRRRSNLTPVSNVCEAELISFVLGPQRTQWLPEACFANHDAYSNRGWYTGAGPEQGFRRCFADGPNQSSVSSVAQATEMPFLLYTWNLKQKERPRTRSFGSTGWSGYLLTREAPLVCAFSRLTDSNCCCVNDGTDLSVCKNKRQTCNTNVRYTTSKYR